MIFLTASELQSLGCFAFSPLTPGLLCQNHFSVFSSSNNLYTASKQLSHPRSQEAQWELRSDLTKHSYLDKSYAELTVYPLVKICDRQLSEVSERDSCGHVC